MNTFAMLSPLVRAWFAFWALLICLISIMNIILAFSKKKYLFGSFGAILLVVTYIFWQVIFDLSLLEKNGGYSSLSEALTNIGWIYWLLIFIFLTISTFVLLIYNIHYEKNYITPNSIKTYLDQIDCGVCCYKDNGQVLFANICINDLCVKLSGTQLLNGLQFEEVIKDKTVSIGEERWRFTSREIILTNEHLHEIIASNITNEYNKTKILEQDKIELSRIKKELQEHNLSIDEVVRHQEILQAKINIHDEMNRLMLSSVATDKNDIESMNQIFSLWKENASLLSIEASENNLENMVLRIKELAKATKIKLIITNEIPALLSEEQRGILFQTAQEAIANAAKHAKADEMTITFRTSNESIDCLFINNGIIPQNKVVFRGGLANLDKLAKKYGASLMSSYSDKFTLTLCFSIKNSQTADVKN